MNFFAVFLRKLETSCDIGAYSAAIFKKVLYKKWPPLALTLSQYRALFANITSAKRRGTPILEKSSSLRTEREFP